MTPSIAPWLAAWTQFYVIIGCAGATLTGLMFVVITITSQSRSHDTARMIAAFGTPTVVHFCAAVLVASTLAAPWRELSHAGAAIAAYGAMGVAYALLVARRTRHQEGYAPVFEDWLWHAIIPLAAYAALGVAGLALPRHPEPVLFVIAAATIMLLFVGIHNSWDTMTYTATSRALHPSAPSPAASLPSPTVAPLPGAAPSPGVPPVAERAARPGVHGTPSEAPT